MVRFQDVYASVTKLIALLTRAIASVKGLFASFSTNCVKAQRNCIFSECNCTVPLANATYLHQKSCSSLLEEQLFDIKKGGKSMALLPQLWGNTIVIPSMTNRAHFKRLKLKKY
ncbi:hypothetical protein A33I_16865 [Alkalihalophilus marmarensis DSM 21297]|nr:hypothetical protein A33I_16865 [Alkalihalophilus marmarensis DSM 21297]